MQRGDADHFRKGEEAQGREEEENGWKKERGRKGSDEILEDLEGLNGLFEWLTR